jgi:oligopeptide transport system substrate-binding protein
MRRLLVLGLVLAMALGTVTAFAQEGEKTVLRTTRQMGASDIPTLDPSQASDVPSVQVIDEIFPTLGRLNEETVLVEPGMASWEISEDGLVYTFSILPEIPWVQYNMDSGEVEQVMDADGNPRYVTANDFITGYRRTLDPLVASDYSGVLAPWVAGGTEWANSDPEAGEEERQALMEGLGLVAVDDYTLELTVPRASAAVESIISMWVTTAEPGWLIDEVGDFWIEPESIQSYGPWAVKDWVHDESLTMIANPFWPGTDQIPQPTIDEIEFLFLDSEPSLAAYEADEIQVSEVPVTAIDRINADAELSQELHSSFGTCTYYYGFNQENELLSDARVVRAFSMALDRQSMVDNITRRGETPAGFFTLPNMVAAPQQADYPDLAIHTDQEAAAALFQEYLDETGHTAADFNNITLLYNTGDLHASIAQAAQQMWLETLGVEVQLASQDFGTYLDLRRDADIYRAAWCFDYPDTNNWLFDVFHSSNDPDNHFSNAEYDAIVEDAAVAPTPEERAAMYAQAEGILVNTSASIAPIYYYSSQDLTKPGIERTYSGITRERYEKWSFTE